MAKKGKKRKKRKSAEQAPEVAPTARAAGGESIRFAESPQQQRFASKSFGQVTKVIGAVAKSLRPPAAREVLEEGPSAEEVEAAVEARQARAGLGQNFLLLAGIAVAAMLFLGKKGAFKKRLQ